MAPATLPQLLEATAAVRPDAPAFGGLRWADVARRVEAMAGGLAGHGIGPGDRVALFLPNRPDFLVLLLALARRGACAILLNTRFRAAELANLLARAQPVAIAVARDFPGVDPGAILAAVPGESRASLRFVLGADALGAGVLAGLHVLPLSDLHGASTDCATPESPALTYTTSGTTAGPKLVLHSQLSLARHAQDVAARIGLDKPGAAFLAVVPLCGTFGLTAALAALAGGAAIVMQERFEALAADALIRAERVTHLVGGDELLLKLAEAAGGRAYAPLAFTGFANFHGRGAAVLAASAALNLAVRGVYGSSEAQALFAVQQPGVAPGGGLPVSGDAQFRIDDEGGLHLRGPSMFAGYLGALSHEGWFATGDLAAPRADAGGFDFITRSGDALRLAGFLVAPEEIEVFLATQPGVRAVQVVEAEGKPVAFVIPEDGFEPEALLHAAKRDLAGFKVPVRIVTLEAFPVTDGPNGPKIQRAALRALARE